ncbi:hypothetical protein F5884DRAFT_771159 [Xylogone sp. PMI_703]|nr:hypothetical protein F5884DRAFT_771159 [Xylogone sp. PMI_703]
MNNDSTPTPAAAPDLPNPQHDAANSSVPTTSNQSLGIEVSQQEESVSITVSTPTRAQQRAIAHAKKRYEFITSLMWNLDILIYAELCTVYYLDCSFFRLFLRSICQFLFLTPKPQYITKIPGKASFLEALLGSNAICILLHLITRRPEAGEAMRGYLHGGIIIDLIGQRGPTSKAYLVMMDLLIMALQCFMLAVHVERQRLNTVIVPTASATAGLAALARAGLASNQDHDSEERGVLRDAAVTNSGDVEMRNLSRSPGSPSHGSEGADEERGQLLDEQDNDDDENPLDLFYSGTSVIGDFHILYTLRSQWGTSGSGLQRVRDEIETASRHRRLNAAGRQVQRGLESLSI